MTSHRYVIMANGRGTRWNNFGGHPKQLLPTGSETLLQRLVRQVHEADRSAHITITATDPRFEVRGAERVNPGKAQLEIDRFTPSLLEGPLPFLYADVVYPDCVIDQVRGPSQAVRFVGDRQSLIAVSAPCASLLRSHVRRISSLERDGKISGARGWQLYQSSRSLPISSKVPPIRQLARDRDFIFPVGPVAHINQPADLPQLRRVLP